MPQLSPALGVARARGIGDDWKCGRGGGSAQQCCLWAPHVRRLRTAMLSVGTTRAAPPHSNVVCRRHTCRASAQQCCPSAPHVRWLGTAMLSVGATRAAAPHSNVVCRRHTCGASAQQCCLWAPHVRRLRTACCPWTPHVRRLRTAMLSVGATRAAAPHSNVVRGRHTCGGSEPQRCPRAPYVRAIVQERYTSASPHISP